MLRRAILPFVLPFPMRWAAGDPPPPARDSIETLEATIVREMAAREVPGVAATLVRGGAIAWSGCFGKAHATLDTPVDGTTLFPAASCSKAVAALAALRLAKRGTLDLDAPLLTTWKPPARPSCGPVTVRSLVAHRAGLSIHGVPGYDKGDLKARTADTDAACGCS